MNGGPYRTPQPTDRRIINRSEQPQRSSDESQTPSREEPPKVTQRPPASTGNTGGGDTHKSSKRGLFTTIILILVVALGAIAVWFFMSMQSPASAIDSSKYQAVFLSNGQAYLGKLENFNDESFRITNVYLADSPQTNNAEATTEETAETAENTIKLVPITGSVHGPEDEMIIMKDQVLFYENLREDSQAARLLEQQN